jgi:hypothetical protein
VVERVATYDHVSRNREEFGAFRSDGTPPVTNEDAASHVPPVLTRT